MISNKIFSRFSVCMCMCFCGEAEVKGEKRRNEVEVR